jgi:hypothetical protein
VDLRIQCLCIDTTDPSRLASFWQSALGWRRTHERDEQVHPRTELRRTSCSYASQQRTSWGRIACTLTYGRRIRLLKWLGSSDLARVAST